jgi:hypothetical protein
VLTQAPAPEVQYTPLTQHLRFDIYLKGAFGVEGFPRSAPVSHG